MPNHFPVFGPCSWSPTHWDSSGDGKPDLACDIFGHTGQALIAVTSGYADVQNYPSGGHTVTLYGADGRVYYYAHLVMGSAVSGHVRGGQKIGEMDNTGNAAGTPTHVHFAMGTWTHGIDQYGQGDIAPWPWLKRWDEDGGGEEDPAVIAELTSKLGYLQGDVADALQSALNSARGADARPSKARREAYDAMQAAINTLRQ